MEMELKFKSVAFKWFSNVFLVIFIIDFVLEIAFCIFVNSYYNNRVQRSAEELAQVFITPLEHAAPENFEAVAREYCEQFEHKDRIEIQILNTEGKVLISTTGFAETPSAMPDFDKAYKENPDVVFLRINATDGVYETREKADAYVAAEGFSFPVYYDVSSLAQNAYNLSGYPTTVFINAQGDVVAKETGMISYETLIRGIELITDSAK